MLRGLVAEGLVFMLCVGLAGAVLVVLVLTAPGGRLVVLRVRWELAGCE
jgi:hypothetical protein